MTRKTEETLVCQCGSDLTVADVEARVEEGVSRACQLVEMVEMIECPGCDTVIYRHRHYGRTDIMETKA